MTLNKHDAIAISVVLFTVTFLVAAASYGAALLNSFIAVLGNM